jgi:Flp pilus assembly protein TadD
LQVKLDAALRDLVRGRTEAKAQAQETANQLAALRARIEVLEARPIPYSPEELAMMKAPAPRLAASPAPAKQASPPAQPAATSATLIAEAQRQFAARQYDKAEESYLQALRRDERSVVTLANLAVTEMQLGKLDDAEARAQQAVTVAPDDAFSHLVLGQVKMRQEKYDDAVDALSRSAQLNPQSAEAQNFLGIALSHKGLRLPAETALRKAITLEPGYGSAHNNLAVIYLNQNPPMVALARWHYQKALAAGAAKNPELEKALEEKGASTVRP